MIQITAHMKIFVSAHAIDFRKGIDGIARVCKDKILKDPFSGALFIFRNKSKTGLKILVYDSQGFWLCHKRLSSGKLKWWPSGGDDVSSLEAHELHVLIAGGNPTGLKCAETWRKIS